VAQADASVPVTVIGWGSNVLPSDQGVEGLVIRNLSNGLTMDSDGDVVADSGLSFQELFLKTTQAGWAGFEYAVGIPGSLGGAMVSNAGAYRSQVSEFLTELDVVIDGQRRWVKPDWMQFSYRNSILRQANPPRATIIRARFRLPKGDRWKSFQEAREYQRQRISKQPPSPSAGSFFKNVESHELAAQIPTLPAPLKEKGIVPAGFLIEAVGFKGKRHGGVGWGQRHANFMLNLSQGTATEVAELSQLTIETVRSAYGVTLESEVLYLGRW
jgi:UDP-N-acetylmuramate dehydrogenase